MKVHDNPDTSHGTSFHGHHFIATPGRLREIFGEPQFPDGDYTIDEWVLDHEGETVTIYHRGQDHYPMEQPIRWHIGARRCSTSLSALLHIRELLTPTT